MGFKYLINTNPSCDVTIFVKGTQNAKFCFRIFLKISETLKTHISGTEADINKQFSWFLTIFHISQ